MAAITWWAYGVQLVDFAEIHKWHLDQIYTAMFGMTAITTGFLGTFYGTIHSMTTGFIQRIRDTTILKTFLHYTRTAIVIGFISSIVSMIMMVITPLPSSQTSWNMACSLIWIFLSIWAVLGFYRVASLLFLLFESNTPDERSGQ